MTNQNHSDEPQDLLIRVIQELGGVFAFARGRWVRIAEEVHPELGGAGMVVLQTILRKGPVTATGLGQILNMDKAVVSRQVAKLRELNLVTAEAAPEDRRVQLLTGTKKSNKVLAKMHEQLEPAYKVRLREFSEDELETFYDLLHRFNLNSDDGRQDSPAVRWAREHAEEDDVKEEAVKEEAEAKEEAR